MTKGEGDSMSDLRSSTMAKEGKRKRKMLRLATPTRGRRMSVLSGVNSPTSGLQRR